MCFTNPQVGETLLGALPMCLSVIRQKKAKFGRRCNPNLSTIQSIIIMQRKEGAVQVFVASIEGIKFSHKELRRGQSLPGKTPKSGNAMISW
mmetsp:Transcript_23386/g.48946  ORF Transcript_23386/g.48946 Transcript_23386/m.48946 type:complete len:92 (+) Transcript_23386:59-334(+)